jgi:hypothetical protein
MATTLATYAGKRVANYSHAPSLDVEILPDVHHCAEKDCGRVVTYVREMTKGKILNERAVKVTHEGNRVHVSWDGKVQYSAVQDGWTSEASAIREAYRMLLDTVGAIGGGCPDPYTEGVGRGLLHRAVESQADA